MNAKPTGRPKGSPNVRETAVAKPSACPKCKSTKRTPYRGRMIRAYSGIHDGQPYTHIVRRRTKCTDCEQTRIDRSYENWPDGPPDEDETDE